MKAVRIFRPAVLASVVLFLAACKHPPVSFVDRPDSFPGVDMKDVTFFSRALGRDMTYRVYLPKEISRGKLPAAYLLHGCGTSYRDWSNYSDVGAYAGRGLVLVMVDGGCSYYTGSRLFRKPLRPRAGGPAIIIASNLRRTSFPRTTPP